MIRPIRVDHTNFVLQVAIKTHSFEHASARTGHFNDSEMQDQVDVEEVLNLLTKIVDVQLPERKGLVKDGKVAIDKVSDSLENSFRERVIIEFPSLCADSLPHDGPAARQ
jgi:hypothetical protein